MALFRRKQKVQLLRLSPKGTQYGDAQNERIERAKSLDIEHLLTSSGSAEDPSDAPAGSHDRERKLTPPPRSSSPTPRRRDNIRIIPLMQPKRPLSACLSSPMSVSQQSPTSEVEPATLAATPPRPGSSSPVHRHDIKIVPLMQPKHPASAFLSSPTSVSQQSPTREVEPATLVATHPHPGSDSSPPEHRHDVKIVPVIVPDDNHEVSFEITMPSEEETPTHEISYPAETTTSTPKAAVIRRPEKKQLHTPPSGRPRSYTSPNPPQVKIVPLMAPKNPKALGSPLGRAPLAVDESPITVKSKSKATSSPMGPGPSVVKQREKEVKRKPKGTSSPFGPIATAIDDTNTQKKAGKASLDRHGGLGPSPISFDDD